MALVTLFLLRQGKAAVDDALIVVWSVTIVVIQFHWVVGELSGFFYCIVIDFMFLILSITNNNACKQAQQHI